THLNRSFFTVRQDLWSVVSKGVSPILPVRPTWIAPLSRRAVERLLRRQGFEAKKGRGKGSHHVYAKPEGPTIVLPDVKDLSPIVLRNTATALGLKNARELTVLAS